MPTSRTTDGPLTRGADEAGFTLLELTLALLIMSLMATLALPFVRPSDGAAGLRAKAYEAAAVLRADRTAARRTGKTVVTGVEFPGPYLRSGATGQVVDLSRGLAVRASGYPGRGVVFYPDGRSSGGSIALATRTVRLDVAVDDFTSGVTIRAVAPDAR